MKFLHTADLHLDSPMDSKLPPEKAKERRAELLTAFSRMAERASEIGVRAVIIAGDLFDRKKVTRRAMKYVLDTAARYSGIDFLVLEGNHDGSAFENEILPNNFKLFSNEATFFDYENIRVSAYSDGVTFDPSFVNISVFHGADGTDLDVSRLGGKGIDYLALGHYHSYSTGKLDPRGVWCYSGCPAGRGFDECGEKGFIIIEVENKNVSHSFVPLAGRSVIELDVDMSDGVSLSEQERIISDALSGVDRENLVRVRITGTFELGRDKFYDHIAERYKKEFYYFEIKDESGLKIEPKDYAGDISLKGEFIRLVMKEMPEGAARSRVISMGIKALRGEDIE